MAAEFIGSTVLVTLRSPPNGQVCGVVADITGQQLTLHDVTWLASGRCSPSFPIDASNILDLEVTPETVPQIEHQPQPSVSTPTALTTTDDGLLPSPLPGTSPARPLHSPTPTSSHGGRQAFIDPAILSFGKPPTKAPTSSVPHSPKAQPSLILHQLLEDASKPNPTQATLPIITRPYVPVVTKPKHNVNNGLGISRNDSLATATLSEPFDDLSHSANPKTEDGSEWDAAELGMHGGKGEQVQLEPSQLRSATANTASARQNGKRARRGNRGAKGTKNTPSTQHVEEAPTYTLLSRTQKAGNVMKVASQTPLVEADATMVASPATIKDSRNWQEKKLSRRDRGKAREARNGWATEDATDIQEMGDFDFAGNLSKFDKRGVFNQLREEDDTADEARLVSHNRVPPKPGTAGGKNLHWTENVLTSPKPNGFAQWNSEAGESENDISDGRVSSRRSSRNTSRASFRRPQSRKGSAKAGDTPNLGGSRFPSGSLRVGRYSSLDKLSSPKPGRNMSTSPFTGSITTSRPSLRIQGSNKLCPCLTPLQTLEFEAFAVSELGLTDDMMTENAARGIAESCLNVMRSVEKGQGKNDSASNPVILIATGNHKTGARAIAAGRHLRNHGFRVTVTIMGLDREEDLLDVVKQQANAYRKAGGNLLKPNELLEAVKGGSVRPTFLVDALLGIHTCFEDLRRDDQAFYFELVIWVNRSAIDILSIDVPSGLDSSSGMQPDVSLPLISSTFLVSTETDFPSGELTIVDDEPLALFPKAILSLGAPKPWLLATLKDRGQQDDTKLFLADVGISNLAWKRLGNRRSRGIDFGGEWVVRLRYQAGVE
ncbi:enhancer of mRNA decapping [Trapelia coarctata]|nr:enhancer of mRNA decapping [Trapelia coarctata]